MISFAKLAWIDQRLREAYSESNDEYFAGFSIIVAGDFYQLPPVSGTALFEPRAKMTIGVTSKRYGRESSIAFRRVLEDMREGNPDVTDFRTLEPRLISTLERREQNTFEEQAVYLFATRASVDDMNFSRLSEANVPVLLLRARHSNCHGLYSAVCAAVTMHYITSIKLQTCNSVT
ncbi:hypothetical protein E4U58_001360 [Claviceps cyperi]|nr:hypothetical protein E4U58_001360 [Claviceps cyperi]